MPAEASVLLEFCAGASQQTVLESADIEPRSFGFLLTRSLTQHLAGRNP